jgi:ABC-2 type transport system permease protein
MGPYSEALRATRLLAGLRLRRLLNMSGRAFRFQGQSNGTTARQPQNALARAAFGWLVMSFVLVATIFSLSNGVRYFLYALRAHSHAETFNLDMLRGMTMLTALLWLISVLYPFSLTMRAGPDWDFEWISTLPMSRFTLLCARIVERSIVNPLAWLALFTPCATVAWYTGAGSATPLYAIAVVVPLLLTVSSIWTVLDMGLHILLAPGALRNLQSILSIAVVPAMFLVFYLHSPNGEHYALVLADHTPDWSIWTPPGVAIQALGAEQPADALRLYALLLLEVALLVLLCVAFLRYQLRAGLFAHGVRESGRSSGGARRLPARPGPARKLQLSPILWRELTLFKRDRRLLVQFLGVPLVMIGSQFFINGHIATALAQTPAALAAAAFGVGTYVLTQSAMQTLATEQASLWMLYTFPRPIMRVLWEKAQFYFVLALSFPVVLCAVCLTLSRVAPWQFATGFALAVLGLAIYTAIAVSLGVLSGIHSRWSKVLNAYLFLLLTGFYAYALFSDDWRRELPMIVLCSGLAFALWQKAADKLPWLLDPSSAPPPAVALADGMIAATIFFIVQIIALVLLKHAAHVDGVSRVVLAYVCAGAVTYALARGTFLALGTRDLPKILGPHAAQSVLSGAGVGLLCAGVGLVYLWVAQHYGFASVGASAHRLSFGARIGISLLSVCAAPVFEEFVFRGLIFGGLRRSLNLPLSALGSAALFAIVHPTFAMVPVFFVGLGTAWVYERRRMLLASMTTHAVYNAVIVGCQLFILTT